MLRLAIEKSLRAFRTSNPHLVERALRAETRRGSLAALLGARDDRLEEGSALGRDLRRRGLKARVERILVLDPRVDLTTDAERRDGEGDDDHMWMGSSVHGTVTSKSCPPTRSTRRLTTS